jgi:hypothetical protein
MQYQFLINMNVLAPAFNLMVMANKALELGT